jgi:predicted ATP-dependent endonuclease of OLD family
MNLYLDNIGKISDSTIIIDGLTIITGENNSGKTTVGKTLYSIVSAVENLQQSAFVDIRNYAVRAINRAFNNIELYRYARFGLFEINKRTKISNISSVFYFEQPENIEDILSAINEKIKELKNCSEKDIDKFFEEWHIDENQNTKKRLVSNFMKKRTEVIKALDEVGKNLQTDPKLAKYTNAKIITTLKKEFYNQIRGINNESKESRIRLSNEDESFYDIKLSDNELCGKKEIFLTQAFDSSLFVDDVVVIDEMSEARKNRNYLQNEDNASYDDFLSHLPNKIHREKLLDKLINNNNSFEEGIYKKAAEKVIKCMKEASLGQMAFVENKYLINGLDIRNLAMGSKMFLIIKTLMEGGHCGSKTLLVLDEPESHLHPEWQNIFAETIVLLVKYLKTKVVITTHSPNFLLAIDVFSKKHKMREVTHFYKSTLMSKGKNVRLEIVDDNINEIYAKMTRPFVKLEAMVNYASDESDY